jgi:ABC-type phosphonate transport system ATPase subunit
MVKVIFLMKFREDLDPEEVRRWWRNDHGALALRNMGTETCRRTLASPEWQALDADGTNGFDMSVAMGGFVTEHVMRWDAAPDQRPYTAAD